MLLVPKTSPNDSPAPIGPRLIFFCELEGPALLALLHRPQVLDTLAAADLGVAMAMLDRSDERIEATRLLNAHHIYTVAWLVAPAAEGYWFNLQNYPQAMEHYRMFYVWASDHNMHFDAVGLDIEPPLNEVRGGTEWGVRALLGRLFQARENVLYPAARAAYSDLIGEMHTASYEVHAYQLPLVVDDRRAGTTLLQRALDIVELPADVEVLTCYSSLPIERLSNDLGGALIASYGPAADGVAIGISGGGATLDAAGDSLPPLSWEALERDLLLSAHYADTIYIFSLEGCVERDLLPRIATLDWSAEARPLQSRLLVVRALRLVLLAVLVLLRFSGSLLAWSGWALALALLLRQGHRWWKKRRAVRQALLVGKEVVTQEGLEPPTPSSEDWCSIH